MWPFTRRSDQDFASEIEVHVAIEADRLIAEGVPAEEARFQARRRFGNLTSARERFYESTHPTWLADAQRDLQYAVRSLVRNRRFSIAAIFTLALGIGGSVAMFAAIDTLFLRQLPYRDADRVVLVWQAPPGANDRLGVAPAVFLHWRERAASVAAMAALAPASFDYLSGAEPVTLNGATVSPGFFEILGVEPVVGRSFRPDDHVAGRSDVVLLSDGAWRRVFGGDRGIVGRTIALEGRRSR